MIEPPKCISKFIYNCGRSFITEPIEVLFQQHKVSYGIIEIYGEETIISKTNDLFELEYLAEKTARLQKRQSRGGQSQNRIARLRLETIHNYLMMAAEKATINFTTDGSPNIDALLIVGHGIKKEQIIDYLDQLNNIPIIVRAKIKQDPLMPYIIDFVSGISTSTKAIELTHIDELFQKSPDLLVFGDETKTNPNIKKIYDSVEVISKYGGPIGELYFASDQ